MFSVTEEPVTECLLYLTQIQPAFDRSFFNEFQICDRIKYPSAVSIVGNMFMATAFLFVGPVPFITRLQLQTILQV